MNASEATETIERSLSFPASNQDKSGKQAVITFDYFNLVGFKPQDYLCVFQSLLSLFLFETKQIGLPLFQLKKMCRQIDQNLAKEARKIGEPGASVLLKTLPKYDQQMIQFVKQTDILFLRFAELFNSHKVSKVLILIGSTPFNPKQSLLIDFATFCEKSNVTSDDQIGPENMGYGNCANGCVQKIHKFYFTLKFLSQFKSKFVSQLRL